MPKTGAVPPLTGNFYYVLRILCGYDNREPAILGTNSYFLFFAGFPVEKWGHTCEKRRNDERRVTGTAELGAPRRVGSAEERRARERY